MATADGVREMSVPSYEGIYQWYRYSNQYSSPGTTHVKEEKIEVITLDSSDDEKNGSGHGSLLAEERTSDAGSQKPLSLHFVAKMEESTNLELSTLTGENSRETQLGCSLPMGNASVCKICKRKVRISSSHRGKSFAPSLLRDHVIQHSEKSFFGCPHCAKYLKTFARLRHHKQTSHGDKSSLYQKKSESEFDAEVKQLMGKCFEMDDKGKPQRYFEKVRLMANNGALSETVENPARKTPEIRPIKDKISSEAGTVGRKLTCKICERELQSTTTKQGKECFAPSQLRKHAGRHSNKSFLGCSMCKDVFKDYTTLRSHVKRVHVLSISDCPKPLKLESEKVIKEDSDFWMRECFGLDFNGRPINHESETTNNFWDK